MSKSTLAPKVIIGVILACAVLAAAITGAAFFLRQRQGLPSAGTSDANLPKPPQSTMRVHLTDPIGATNLKTGEILPIHGQVLSNYPVASLELWVNGKMVEGRKPPVGIDKTFFLGLWNWQPTKAGAYKLSLRGIDRGGRSAYSNMTTIVVEDYQEIDMPILPTPEPAQLTPAPDATPGVPPVIPVIKLAGSNAPTFSGGLPAPEGGAQSPSTPDPNLPPIPGPDDASPTPADGPTEPSGPGSPPEMPSFNVKVTIINPDPCTTDLEIEDLNHQATGFSIERTGPQDSSYYPLTTIKAEASKSIHHLDNSAKYGGTYYYKITVFDSMDSQELDLIEISYPDTCANETWNGVVFADMKVIPKTPVENLHCFIWLDTIVWNRIPPAEGSSIPPMSVEDLRVWENNLNALPGTIENYSFTAGYDLTPFAPDLSKTGFSNFQLSVRCVNQTSDTAITLGTAKANIDLKYPDQLTVLSANQFDVYLYIGSQVMLGNQPSIDVGIASPYAVETSGDPAICPPHLQDHCSDYVKANYAILRWKWKPKPCFYGSSDPDAKTVCVEKPSHFKIYRYTGSPLYTEVGDGFLGDIDMAGYFYAWQPLPEENTHVEANDTNEEKLVKEALSSMRYCIRAVSSESLRSLESEDTAENCLSLKDFSFPDLTQTVELSPVDTGVYFYGESSDESGEAWGAGYVPPDGEENLPPGVMYSGQWYPGDEADMEDYPYAIWAKYGYFRFSLDQTQLMGKQIISATLYPNGPRGSCLMVYDSGSHFFDLYGDMHGLILLNRKGSPGYHAQQVDGTWLTNWIAPEMDVTNEVRMWADGSVPNNGFMFGIKPTIIAVNYHYWVCDAYYGPVKLVVKYLP